MTPSSSNGNAATCLLRIFTPQKAPSRDRTYSPSGTAHIHTLCLLYTAIPDSQKGAWLGMLHCITTCRHKVMPAFPKCLLGTQSKVPEASQQPAFVVLRPAVICFYTVTVPMCTASVLSGLCAWGLGFSPPVMSCLPIPLQPFAFVLSVWNVILSPCMTSSFLVFRMRLTFAVCLVKKANAL